MQLVSIENVDLTNRINAKLNSESRLYYSNNELFKIISSSCLDNQRQENILNLEKIDNGSCIIPNYAIINENGICGYSMNYYKDYLTLASFINSNLISLDDRKQIINKIEDILRYFKSIGFYYFDIHGNNILINDNYDILFADMDSGIFGDYISDNDKALIGGYINYFFAEMSLKILLECNDSLDFYYDFSNSRKNDVISHLSSDKSILLKKVLFNSQDDVDICSIIDKYSEDDVDEIQYRLRLI